MQFGTMALFFKLKQNGICSKIPSILSEFLKDNKQRVALLHQQISPWKVVNTRVPERSILGPLLFLVHLNNQADGLSSKAKLCADVISLFSVIHNVDTCANELNNNLDQINKWAFQ